MRHSVEAFDRHGQPIVGSLFNRVWYGEKYTASRWYRALPKVSPVIGLFKIYRGGKVVEIVYPKYPETYADMR